MAVSDHDWFGIIVSRCALPERVAQDLRDVGFSVIPGPVAPDGLAKFVAAYDAAMASAAPADVSTGRSTTRVHDFVNRGPAFDGLYLHPPLLAACRQVL